MSARQWLRRRLAAYAYPEIARLDQALTAEQDKTARLEALTADQAAALRRCQQHLIDAERALYELPTEDGEWMRRMVEAKAAERLAEDKWLAAERALTEMTRSRDAWRLRARSAPLAVVDEDAAAVMDRVRRDWVERTGGR